MHVLRENIPMIGVNSVLALIPLFCGWLMGKTRQKVLQLVLVSLWFFFLPNTLYILTDMRYLPEQWHRVHAAAKLALALQYLLYDLLGVACFLLALSAFEKLFLRSRWRKNHVILIVCLIIINFCIGLGIVLGRVQRLNSWDIFVDAPTVIAAALHNLSSLRLLLFVLLFGIFSNAVYFVFRRCRGAFAAVATWVVASLPVALHLHREHRP
jgi:uncharacterized membrane protein